LSEQSLLEGMYNLAGDIKHTQTITQGNLVAVTTNSIENLTVLSFAKQS
jgi:hypothetical protein